MDLLNSMPVVLFGCAILVVIAIIFIRAYGSRQRTRKLRAQYAASVAAAEKREAEQSAEADAWVKAVEAASTDEEITKLDYPYFGIPQDERLLSAVEKWFQATADMQARQWRTSTYDTAPISSRPREMLKAYCNSINLTAAFDESEAEVGKRFKNDMAATFELFYSKGDLDAMKYYWEIFDDYPLEGFCEKYGVTPVPTLPNNWDTLVDWNVPEPEPDLYVCSKTLTPQGIQTLAGQAIAARDALLAKRVLVLSLIEDFNSAGDVIYPYRDALGDHMLFALQVLKADPKRFDQLVNVLPRTNE